MYSDQGLYKKPIIKESTEQFSKSPDEQVKIRDTMQNEFINIVAHELRTPIQPILGLTEILRHRIKDTEQLQLLDAIVRNAKRLQQLTDDILDITQIEHHSLTVTKEQFNLNEVITNIIDDIIPDRHLYKNGKIIKLLYRPNDVFVEADKGRIIQVISNLLTNALKFTKKGFVSIEVEEKKREKGKQKKVVIMVKDTGIGLDSQILPKLFSKFATKSHRHREGGMGLGLFICKNTIEAHDGRIWAENNADGEGATFTFILPAYIKK